METSTYRFVVCHNPCNDMEYFNTEFGHVFLLLVSEYLFRRLLFMP